jgi:hypothetical protein
MVFALEIVLYDLKYSAPVMITIDDVSDFYLFRLTLEGQCKVGIEDQQVLQSVGIMSITHPHTQQQSRPISIKPWKYYFKLAQHDVETHYLKCWGIPVMNQLS